MYAMLKNSIVEEELTYKIIGCGLTVYNELGSGRLEKIYQKALSVSLEKAGLKFKEEVALPVYFSGVKVGTGRADLIVEEKVIVELKRTNFFNPADFAQLKNYLCSKDLQVGLMFRFASDRLIYRRVVNLNDNGSRNK